MRRRAVRANRNYVPNTFIGGIAKLGGTGVNAPILTAAQLATTLGISESIINGFKVVGEDVECMITKGYNIGFEAFGSQTVNNANQNITYYIDIKNCKSIYGTSAFENCKSLTNIDFPYVTIFGLRIFRGCTALTTINLPILETSTYAPFFGCTSLTNVNLPNINSIGDSAFYGCNNLLTVFMPKLKACGTTVGGLTVFNGIKMNTIISVHINLKTAENGEIDADLLYAYNSRNAIINFYDDNGNFVETYNPNPPNEIDWTVHPSPENNYWHSITTDGNGTWIGVASSGTNQILKSVDNGVSWSVQSSPENNQWYSIATDGNGTWIGVSITGTNRILKSVDNGVSWSVQSSPENNQWRSIATDRNGTWIGVSSSSTNRILKGIEVY